MLDDGIAVMSERGTADLLGVDQKLLNRMRTNWPPKTLKPFVDEGWSMRTNSVEVVAENSPYRGRRIIVYTAETIEMLISTYATGLAYEALKPNQKHIGKRCVILLKSLTRTAIEVAIKEACGLPINVQATAQKTYKDIVQLMKESGLKCSVNDDIAIKTDITNFLDIPLGTLNGFLDKHKSEIKPIKLDIATIRAVGSKKRGQARIKSGPIQTQQMS